MANIKGVIDADGHVVESDRELLQFLPAPFQGREDLLAFPFFPTLDGFHRQARRVADGKGRYIAKGSLKEWQEFLDEDQIAWSVLYPTAGLTFGLVRDKDWACAVAAGYNNYLYETFTKPEKRLKGMALIPLQSIPDAVKELKRAVNELGFVGAVLPAVGLRQPLGETRPRVAAIRALPDAAPRTAAAHQPRQSLMVPERRIEDARVRRVHRQVTRPTR